MKMLICLNFMNEEIKTPSLRDFWKWRCVGFYHNIVPQALVNRISSAVG